MAQGTASRVRYGAALPASCAAYIDIFSLTSGTPGFNYCNAGNAWTKLFELNPTITQTLIAPATSGIPLQIKGRAGNTSNLFEIFDNAAPPVLKLFVDKDGNITSNGGTTLNGDFTFVDDITFSGTVTFSGGGAFEFPGSVANTCARFNGSNELVSATGDCLVGPPADGGVMIGSYGSNAAIGSAAKLPLFSAAGASVALPFSHVPFPISGYLRNHCVQLTAAPAAGLVPILQAYKNGIAHPYVPSPGGFYVAASGDAVCDSSTQMIQVQAGESVQMNYAYGVTVGGLTIGGWGFEFVSELGYGLLGSQAQSTTPGSSTRYIPFLGDTGASVSNATEAATELVLPLAGSFKLMTTLLTGAQPGDGAQVVTIRLNEVDTTVTATIAASSPVGMYADLNGAHTAAFVAGDRVNLEVVNASASTSGQLNGIMLAYAPTTSGEGLIGAVPNFTATAGTTNYSTPMVASKSTTEAIQRYPINNSYTIGPCYAYIRTGSSGGNTTTLTIHKNGSDTAAVVSVADTVAGSVAGSGTTTVIATDKIVMKIASVGGTGPVVTSWSCKTQ